MGLFRLLTELFIPWQAPKPLPLKGSAQPYKSPSLSTSLWPWNTNRVNAWPWIRKRGLICSSKGDSNRPTFTGEFPFERTYITYMNGRDAREGDMVACINPYRKRPNELTISSKRVIGLEGYSAVRILPGLGRSIVKVAKA